MDFSKIGALGASKEDPMAKKPKFDELGKDPLAEGGEGGSDVSEIKSKIDSATPDQLEQIKQILGITSKKGLTSTAPKGGLGGGDEGGLGGGLGGF